MIQKEIKIHPDFCRKKENGWINSLKMAGSIHFVNFTLSLIDIAGGASVFPLFVLQNKGWRIDYINVTDPLKKNLKNAEIFPDVKHSDHCPVYLDIEI